MTSGQCRISGSMMTSAGAFAIRSAISAGSALTTTIRRAIGSGGFVSCNIAMPGDNASSVRATSLRDNIFALASKAPDRRFAIT